MTTAVLLLAVTAGLLLLWWSDRDDTRAEVSDPLSDAEASAQVVDAAGRIVGAAGLREVGGGYAFVSCVNELDPPYQAVVVMNFSVPQGNPVGYLNDVAAAMTRDGWRTAPTTAEHFGHKLTENGLTAVFHSNPAHRELATMRISGECRTVSDHRADNPVWRELTDRLRPAR